ncbi:MAG: oligosaccharide flippase family protein [Leptolyngbyaceae cyanobacterium]
MPNIEPLKERAKALVKNPLAKGAFWKLAARLSSLFLQTFYFLIISRSLGAEQYGLFIGVMALIKLLVPFASWGTTHILLKHVSRDRTVFRQYWGNTLCITTILGFFILGTILLLNHIVLPTQFPWRLVLFIGLAELIFARFHDAAIKSFVATENFHLDAQIHILLSVNGLIAALCLLVFFPGASALVWGALYLVSRLLTAIAGFILVGRTLGWPSLKLALLKSEVSSGFFFSVSLSSQTIYNDIDKTMLASMSTLVATGVYGAAYRIIDVAMIPILSLLGATYGQFFKRGASGISGSLAFAKKIMPFAGGYGFLASAAVWLVAPIIPYILGPEYASSVDALRWLSPIIFFKALQFFAADTLTGADLQGVRSTLQAIAAGANALGNLWLIPLYSWKGAAIASLATDGLLVISLWSLVFFYQTLDRTHAQKP